MSPPVGALPESSGALSAGGCGACVGGSLVAVGTSVATAVSSGAIVGVSLQADGAPPSCASVSCGSTVGVTESDANASPASDFDETTRSVRLIADGRTTLSSVSGTVDATPGRDRPVTGAANTWL